jgi:excisionase family DNA binding protein
MNKLDPLMTRQEVAEYLRVSVSTLKLLEIKGAGPPCLRIGRLVRFDPEMVQEWIQQRMNQRRT